MSSVNLTINFPLDHQMNAFLDMLAWMEMCGNVGHCTDFLVIMDGDGNARPKFIFEDSELQKTFEMKRADCCKKLAIAPTVKNIKSADMIFGID